MKEPKFMKKLTSRSCIPGALEEVVLSVFNGISAATGAIRANVVGKEVILQFTEFVTNSCVNLR